MSRNKNKHGQKEVSNNEHDRKLKSSVNKKSMKAKDKVKFKKHVNYVQQGMEEDAFDDLMEDIWDRHSS